MTTRRRVLRDPLAGTYHRYQNCPLVSALDDHPSRTINEQIALDKGLHLCASCASFEGHSEHRSPDLPLTGVDVEPASKIGVALSGGGHRATLFGLGVLMYLVHARRNEDMSFNNDVLEIASVSGGSIANAYVAQSLDYQWATVKEFDSVVHRLASQVSRHGTLFAPWWVRAYVAALVAAAALGAGGLLSVLVLRGSWSASWISVGVVSLALVLLAGILAQWRGVLCERAFDKTLFSPDGRSTRIGVLVRSALHVMCATEVQTGNAAYFSPDFVFSESFEARRPDNLQLATVVQASAALPLAFPPCRIGAEPDKSFGSAWARQTRRPRELLLVDGGVRDNLGTKWFTDPSRQAQEPLYRANVLPFPQVDELIVVSAAANRIQPRRLHAHRPFLGELSSLLQLAELPYDTRELYSRRALLWQFASAPSLQAHDGRLRMLGTLLHIEESPCELATELVRWSERWNTPPSRQNAELGGRRLRLQGSSAIAAETVDTLDWNLLAEAVHRTDAVLDAVARAETEDELNDAARQHDEVLGGMEVPLPHTSRRTLAISAWARRAADNASVRTSLSSLGVETSASLLRHGFVLAMTKLHLLRGYPLCDIPTRDEFIRLAGGASAIGHA